MKLGYDNIEDAQIKLAGTYALYKGRAIHIRKVVFNETDPNKYQLMASSMQTGRDIGEYIQLDDPDLNVYCYSVGYVNMAQGAVWYYRRPLKQWQQGLKGNQVNVKCSEMDILNYAEFRAGKPVAAMLENSYPAYANCIKQLAEGEARMLAFHKDFALKYNRVHADFLVEYKGCVIGYTTEYPGEFKLMPEHQHLIEALREAAA